MAGAFCYNGMALVCRKAVFYRMRVDRREVLRYLGLPGVEPGSSLAVRLDAVEQAVLAAARPDACWRLVPAEVEAEGCLLGDWCIQSRYLAVALRGCRRAFLFAATLGTGVDGLLRRTGQVAPADGVLAQAVATALLEGYCDHCQSELAREIPGNVLRPRFSPGYGDFPLEAQERLFATLEVTRRLGVSLTAAQLMVPTKSVSAIIGCAEREDA